MVHLLSWGNTSKTYALLAKGMCGNVSVTNTLPAPAVAFFYSGVSLVFLVLSVNRFLVFLTEAAVGQPRAAGIAAGPFWFFGQNSTSNWA
jgi:hypothetical protein